MACQDANVSVGTFDVVQVLQKETPRALIILVVGEDAFEDLTSEKWKKSQELLTMVPIVVMAREGRQQFVHYPQSLAINLEIVWQQEPKHYPLVSSTLGRAALNEQELLPLMPEDGAIEMINYMKKHQLYCWKP